MTIKLVHLLSIFIEKMVFTWLKYFNSTLKSRYEFESKNENSGAYCGRDYWFHISSEGELEQVMPFIKYLNTNQKKVLLIYTSPSVEKKSLNLKSKYKYLEVMRLPVIKGSVLSNLELPHYFFMVRYDFFPLLLMIAKNSKVKSVLLSATMKSKNKNFFANLWWKKVYSCFDEVYWSSEADSEMENFLSQKNIKSIEYDFRHAQIIERQNLKEQFYSLEGSDTFVKHINQYEYKRRIILGSIWASELEELTTCLQNLIQKGYLVYLAPHHIKGEEYLKIKEILAQSEMNFCELSSFNDYQGESLVLSRIPGILCDIYPFFKHGYVGGGHGRSVHSLLEPYWAGCEVYCGPKIHRSTEYDYIVKHSKERIHICHDINGLDEAILKCDTNDITNIDKDKDNIIKFSNDYIMCLCNLKAEKDS